MTPDDHRLEALLREGLPAPGVPDDGFTERVMAALPARRGAVRSRRLLLALVWAGTGAGSCLALWKLASWDVASDAAARIGLSSVGALVSPWTVLALEIVLACYLYALLAARAANRP